MSKTGTIKVSRIVNHTPSEMLSLVGDVSNYGKFIPWVKAVRIWDVAADNKSFSAELMIGYKSLRIPFSTRVEIDDNLKRIHTSLINVKRGFSLLPNPLKRLECFWNFIEAEGGCDIDLKIDFDFGDPFLATLITSNTNRATTRLIEIFTAEADNRFATV